MFGIYFIYLSAPHVVVFITYNFLFVTVTLLTRSILTMEQRRIDAEDSRIAADRERTAVFERILTRFADIYEEDVRERRRQQRNCTRRHMSDTE